MVLLRGKSREHPKRLSIDFISFARQGEFAEMPTVKRIAILPLRLSLPGHLRHQEQDICLAICKQNPILFAEIHVEITEGYLEVLSKLGLSPEHFVHLDLSQLHLSRDHLAGDHQL